LCERGALVQTLPEAHGAESEDEDAEDAEHEQLRPEHLYADALEEDAADDLHEVAHGVQQRHPLDGFGHVADGKREAGQHEGGLKEEERADHGLLLSGGEGGEKQACAEGGQEEEDRGEQEYEQAAAKRDLEQEEGDRGDGGHVDEADHGEGDGLAEHQFDGTDGRDHDLLHGADLFFADDGEGGKHEGDQEDDVGHGAGDEVVTAFELGVEPDAGFGADAGEGHANGAFAGAPDEAAGLLSLEQFAVVGADDAAGVIRDDAGAVGVGAVEEDLDLLRFAAEDTGPEAGHDADDGLGGAAVEEAFGIAAVFGHGDEFEVRRRGEAFAEIAAGG